MAGRIPVTAAVDIINGAKEKFGVKLTPHNPCLLRGFYLTTDTPSPELTEYIIDEFKRRDSVVEVVDGGTSFVYKYREGRKKTVGCSFYEVNNNADTKTISGGVDLSGLTK